VREEVREKLDNNIMIEEMREGGIGFNAIIAVSFSVIDEVPERSFEMTKYLYSLLDSVALSINKKNIESSYVMLENRLEQNLKDMEASENALIDFQEANGILEVEEQAKAMVANIAEIKSALVEKEIELAIYRQSLGEQSSRYQSAELAYEELDNLYRSYLNKESTMSDQGDIFKSVNQMPPLFAEYYRLFREVEIQQEIYKVLYPQYEQQKLNYNEINSGLSMIDEPTIPTYKFYPKRAFIVIAFFLVGFVFVVLRLWYEYWLEHIKNEKPELYEKLQSVPFIKA
jgi:capsule polysaccharide export protein KpsE/RkpR